MAGTRAPNVAATPKQPAVRGNDEGRSRGTVADGGMVETTGATCGVEERK